MSNIIDIKLKSYDELQFEVMTLTTNNYLKDLKIKELEDRIQKAIEYIDRIPTDDDNKYSGECGEISDLAKERLLNILKGNDKDIPGFEGTLEELDNLSIRGKDE